MNPHRVVRLEPGKIMDTEAAKSFKHLEAAEIAVAEMTAAIDLTDLKALRTIVAGYPEMGSPGAGDVAASLFMLLERLIAGGRYDHEALTVHVRAWRLMLTGRPGAEAEALMFAGLKAIRSLHIQAKAA